MSRAHRVRVSVGPAGWGNPPRLIGDLYQTGATPLGDFSQGLLPGTGAPGMVVQMVSQRRGKNDLSLRKPQPASVSM